MASQLNKLMSRPFFFISFQRNIGLNFTRSGSRGIHVAPALPTIHQQTCSKVPLLKYEGAFSQSIQAQLFSTPPGQNSANAPDLGQGDKKIVKETRKDKILKAVKEYGTTVVVFHISISLISLGVCYIAVTSGIDLKWLSGYLPIEIPEEVGGFVIAYAIHKTMAPIRGSITLVCSPIIVKYLRGKGYLKPTPPKYYQKK